MCENKDILRASTCDHQTTQIDDRMAFFQFLNKDINYSLNVMLGFLCAIQQELCFFSDSFHVYSSVFSDIY